MKPFQGIIHGSGKNPATQLGTAKSGMQVHLNTIDWGVKITATKLPDDTITMSIYMTGGSYSPHATKHLTDIINQEVHHNESPIN